MTVKKKVGPQTDVGQMRKIFGGDGRKKSSTVARESLGLKKHRK